MLENRYCVGIDVSKYKLDVAVIEDKRTLLNKTFKNDVAGMQALHGCLLDMKAQEMNIGLESTGRYSEPIVRFLSEKKLQVSLINPFQIKQFMRSQLVRTKTDKTDAKGIASYVQKVSPRLYVAATPEIDQLAKMNRELSFLIRKRAEQKSHLESVTLPSVEKIIKELISAYDQSISQLEKEMDRLLREDIDLTHQITLLKSIVGVGTKTALTVFLELIRDQNGTPLLNRKIQTAHAGLAPMEFQSGKSVLGKPRICKFGSKFLRTSLYMATISSIKSNPFISAFYAKLKLAGKPSKVAIIACMRKLLAIMIGVLKNQTPFQSTWISKPLFN